MQNVRACYFISLTIYSSGFILELAALHTQLAANLKGKEVRKMGETKEYHTTEGFPWQTWEKVVVVDKDGNRGEAVDDDKNKAAEKAYQNLRENRSK